MRSMPSRLLLLATLFPAAPVERLRDQINAGIARANRAAGDADTASGTGQD